MELDISQIHNLNWLINDLKKTDKKTLIFVHQRLDNGDDNPSTDGQYYVSNGAQVELFWNQSGRMVYSRAMTIMSEPIIIILMVFII